MVQTIASSATNNDLYLDSFGNLAWSTGEAAVEDCCQTASLMQLGEAIYQTNLGLPTFQTVFSGVPNVAIYESYLRTALMNVPGVVSVTSITANVENNTFSYVATIESVYGRLYLQG